MSKKTYLNNFTQWIIKIDNFISLALPRDPNGGYEYDVNYGFIPFFQQDFHAVILDLFFLYIIGGIIKCGGIDNVAYIFGNYTCERV